MVAKLTRDVSSGVAPQEVNFWSSLERALGGIKVQLRSKEVRMAIDALRNAKGFHAAVSLSLIPC